MGYFGLSVVGSDNAAGSASELENAMVKSLKKALKVKDGNGFNTDGIVNVAMIFDECIIPSNYWNEFGYELKSFAEEVLGQLEKYIAKTEKADFAGDVKNYKYHLGTYKSLAKRLEKFIEE